MKKEITICEICKKEARNEQQLRKENWVELQGGTLLGVQIWLEKPRKKGGSYLHSVGWKDRKYHFCGLNCFIKALKLKESI